MNPLFQVVFSQTSDLAEQPPMESLPSSSKESMTSENLYQTFVSKHFDFLNEEVCVPVNDKNISHQYLISVSCKHKSMSFIFKGFIK